MLKLGEIRNARGAHKEIKRLGRGSGSGRGQTAGKGSKGQLQRSGGKVTRGFEGGQSPLFRRLPKVGFTNIFRKEYAVINLSELSRASSAEVTLESLKADGILKTPRQHLKVLGNGELSKKITVKAHAFSESAKQKIEKAGGKAEVLS